VLHDISITAILDKSQHPPILPYGHNTIDGNFLQKQLESHTIALIVEEYLKQLIAMPTVTNDHEANNCALDYLQHFFEDRQLHVVRHTFNGYGAIVATTRQDTKTPKVMLTAHLDVVPAPKQLFELKEADGNYYGRGVFDMKFAIASYMQTIDMLGADLPSYDIGIMITTDEEIGGLNGVKPLIEMGYRPAICLLPDGAADWNIETLSKGFGFVHITIQGKTAHGSRPWEGDSATFKLIDLLTELKANFKDQTLNTNTLNIALLSGGVAKNQVPAHASAMLDIRFLSENDHQKTTAIIQELCKKYGGTYSEEPLSGHPCVNELAHPLIKPFADSITAVTGAKVSGTISYGSSDARFFAGVGIPSIITRPAGGGQHADEEWIDKQGCLQYPEVIVDYLKKIARL
jgi:succinyl-diaminopimelate desuccinylase